MEAMQSCSLEHLFNEYFKYYNCKGYKRINYVRLAIFLAKKKFDITLKERSITFNNVAVYFFENDYLRAITWGSSYDI